MIRSKPRKNFLRYGAARQWLRTCRAKTWGDYKIIQMLLPNLFPSCPSIYYKTTQPGAWKGDAHFFSRTSRAIKEKPRGRNRNSLFPKTFFGFLRLCKKYKIISWPLLKAIAKIDKRFPSYPNFAYPDQWPGADAFWEMVGRPKKLGYKDWKAEMRLTKMIHPGEYRTLRKTLKKEDVWYTDPMYEFKKTGEWEGWDIILFGCYEELRTRLAPLGLVSYAEYHELYEAELKKRTLPFLLPPYPPRTFKKEWRDWHHLLGFRTHGKMLEARRENHQTTLSAKIRKLYPAYQLKIAV